MITFTKFESDITIHIPLLSYSILAADTLCDLDFNHTTLFEGHRSADVQNHVMPSLIALMLDDANLMLTASDFDDLASRVAILARFSLCMRSISYL